MLAGHYAAALGIGALSPRTPLWLLFVGVQLVDIAWSVFVATGIEVAHVQPGFTASNGLVLEQVVWSHSLVSAFAWAAAAGLGTLALTRRAEAALALAGAVLSHWFLDLPMHVPDLPLATDAGPKFGLRLWNSAPASFALEAALLLGGGLLYARRVPATGRPWVRPALGVLLATLCVSGYYGPQPESIVPTALIGLFVYLSLPVFVATTRP